MKTTIPNVYLILEEKRQCLLKKTFGVLLTDAWKNLSNNSKLVFTLQNKYAHQIYLTYNDTSADSQDGDHVLNHIAGAVFFINYFLVKKASLRKANTELQGENFISDNLWETTCYGYSAKLLLGALDSEDFQSSLSAATGRDSA